MTAPHRTAPHRTAPHRTTPHHTAPQFSSVNQLGVAEFDDIEKFLVLAIKAHPNYSITARSGKKAQYDLAKKILQDELADGAIFVFYDDNGNFRFSFIQADYNGKKRAFSTFRRYSYFVDKHQTNRTFIERFGSSEKFDCLDDILTAFSVEPLNKEFYNAIQTHFDKLKASKHNNEFSVRLIGRLLFCWFLKKRQSDKHQPLIPDDLLSEQSVKNNQSYYKSIIYPLFFEILNKELDDKERNKTLPHHETIPYLNGGLFEKQSDDVTNVTDEWFKGFFATLEQYNFTVDENSSTDTEVGIDPEMLGTIFENLLAEQDPDTGKSARKSSGSFYTPRVIVDYMVEQSLTAYLQQQTEIEESRIASLFTDRAENFTDSETEQLLNALFTLKTLDPACGSGAFPVGVMQKMLGILRHLDDDGKWWRDKHKKHIKGESQEAKNLRLRLDQADTDYVHKLGIISRCLYGVDIQPIASEIAKLRCFLSLIIDEKIDDNLDNRGILPLPNLEFKFVTANTLLSLSKSDKNEDIIQELVNQFNTLRAKYLHSYGNNKKNAKKEFERLHHKYFGTHQIDLSLQNNKLLQQLGKWKPLDSSAICPWFDQKLMFGVDEFDIVIGNPPYVSTKGTSTEVKKSLKEKYGFADDLYSHFFFRGVELLNKKGKLAFITSKTFWTIQTKRNVRDLLLSKKIDYIFDTANPFESAMVDTCIIGISNEQYKTQHYINFLDGRKNLAEPQKSQIEQAIYCNTQNSVIFTPTKNNLAIYEKYGEVVKQLYDKWWDKICTSGKIAKNHKALTEYRDNLQAGDVALLGCLTEGGQGLATANNGKYIAIRSSTKWANNVIKSRPQKLSDAIKKNKITEYAFIKNRQQADDYLSQLSETEITQLFDELKEKYGRDIFGQGYLFRLIDDNEIADVDSLTDDEKQNGIDPNKKYYVPYDKGDKDGNRWYLETPFAIAWTRENVLFLKSNSGKKGKGMPVVRNPQFYFKEGFCWNNVLDPSARLIKTRIKSPSINDVASMSLYSLINKTPNFYLISLLTSNYVFDLYRVFINSTVNIQINDIRQLPIIIPNDEQLANFKDIFDRAVNIQKQRFALEIKAKQAEEELNLIQEQLDKAVYKLYDLTDEEIDFIESKVK